MAANNKAKGVGCIIGGLYMLIGLPIWFAMIYGILLSSNAESWVWTLFWVYIPVAFGFHIAKASVEIVTED
jgi:hypothetical protein